MPAKKQYPEELPADQVEKISPAYRDFKAFFGENDAKQVLVGGAHNRERERKSDYFVDCLVVAIAYDCFTTFNEMHQFTKDSHDYFNWIANKISIGQISFEEYDNQTYKKKFAMFRK